MTVTNGWRRQESETRREIKGRCTRKLNELRKSLDDDKGVEIVKRNYDELTEAWRNVEFKHDTYMIFLEDSEVVANEECIFAMQMQIDWGKVDYE